MIFLALLSIFLVDFGRRYCEEDFSLESDYCKPIGHVFGSVFFVLNVVVYFLLIIIFPFPFCVYFGLGLCPHQVVSEQVFLSV